MGGTSQHNDRTARSTINLADQLFENGDFGQAKNEYLRFLGDHPNDRQAEVKTAICQLRLGDGEALASLRRHRGHTLTAEDKELMTRHLFLQLLIDKRVEAAIALLTPIVSGTDRSCLIAALDVVDNLKRADKFWTNRNQKIAELDEAFEVLADIRERRSSSRTVHAPLISILIDYLSVLVELFHGSFTRNRSIERECRQRIKQEDALLERSLPRSIKLHRYRELFKS